MEININKFYENIDLKLSINKSDYEKFCLKYFEQIVNLIKKNLEKSKLKEPDIDDLILIGNLTKNNILKKNLSKLFEQNKKISNLLTDYNIYDIKKEYYAGTGAILHALDMNKNNPKYKLINVSNLNNGKERLDGLMEFGIKKGNKIPFKNKKF